MSLLTKLKQLLVDKVNGHSSIQSDRIFIYLDTNYPRAIEQIIPYFENGFFNRSDTVVLFKYYFKSANGIQLSCKNYGIRYHSFVRPKKLKISNKSLIFYTHNSNSNVTMITHFKRCVHSLLLHGESDKPASHNRVARLYDYCLASGEFAFQRYIKRKVFSEHDRNKFIFVGRVALNSILPDIKLHSTHKTVFYAPTWEGADSSVDFSCLKNHRKIVGLINRLCELVDCSRLIIKFHPNLGIREEEYIEYANKLIDSLSSNQKNIILVDEEKKKFRLDKSVSWVHSLNAIENFNIDVAVTNNSAVPMQLMEKEIKTIVTAESHYYDSINAYPALLLDISNDRDYSGEIEQYLASDLCISTELMNIGKITYQNADWKLMSNQQIFVDVKSTLLNYLETF